MTLDTLQYKAMVYAISQHASTNHFYNDKPYSFHLQMVCDYALKYIYLVPERDRETVIASCWTHDLIEDCRKTYNDILEQFGIRVAEITYALTNEKGKNRKERANAKYYEGIRNTPGATFVKLCDRLANVKYSKDTGSKMLNAYRMESGLFVVQTYDKQYDDMYAELNSLLSVNNSVEKDS